MFKIDQLEGGRDKIYKEDNCVHRPSEEWTKYIHPFLKYLHERGFDKVPYPYGIDEFGIEKVSYVEGSVHNGLLPDDVKSDDSLISVAKLLRTYHDLGSEYIEQLTGEEKWMLPKRDPIETMCHGDFAPYNIAMDGDKAVGIIDFDTLHPGPRLWDIAYVLYRWIPLMHSDNIENFGNEEDKKRRLSIFKDIYGINELSNRLLIKWVTKRLEALIEFMKNESNEGNETFQEHIEEGHLDTYLNDLAYIKKWSQ